MYLFSGFLSPVLYNVMVLGISQPISDANSCNKVLKFQLGYSLVSTHYPNWIEIK